MRNQVEADTPGDHDAETCFTIARPEHPRVQAPSRANEKVPPQIFAMMTVTTLATFGTLSSGYTLLF